MRPDILCIGEPLIEFRNIDGNSYARGFGGDVSNCCIAASRMGANSAIFTLLGDDRFGDDFLALWNEHGVNHDGVVRLQGAETGVYFIHYREGNHEFAYRRQHSAASQMGAENMQRAKIGEAKILHVSGISQAISETARAAIKEAVAIAKQNAVLVSYDLNFRPKLCNAQTARRNLEEIIDEIDILIPSTEDLCLLYETDDHRTVLEAISRRIPIIALTMGKQGATVIQGEAETHIPAFDVRPVDATGAGDIFDGSFLAEYARHGDPLMAARFANAAAAISTTRQGAVDSMPSGEDVEAMLAKSVSAGE